MREARNWFFRDFNPLTLADFNTAMFGDIAAICAWCVVLGHGRGAGE